MESLSGRRILLVEDERIIAMSEERVLQRYGLTVVTVGTGEAAVATMDLRDDIDLILMDINLGGGMDGTEAAQQILARHEVPLIFLSSHTEREIVERTEGITSYGYIVKNTGETVLIASVKMAFRLWQATLNERAHEQALRAERDRARQYLDTAGVVMVALDREFHITLINERGCEILGYSRDELIGKNWFDTCAPDSTTPECRAALLEVFDGTRQLIEYQENTVRTRAGRRRWIAWHHSLLRDAAGMVVGSLSSGEDVTERNEAENLARRQRAFESLLSETTASLLDTPVEELDDAMTSVLEQLSRFFGVETAGLGVLCPDAAAVKVTNLWSAVDIGGFPDTLTASDHPFLFTAIRSGCTQVYRATDPLPANATEVEAELVARTAAESFVVVPLSYEGRRSACVGFATVTRTDAFTPEVVEEIERVAGVLSGALARREAFMSLRESRECLADIADNAPGLVYQYHVSTDGRVSLPYVGRGAAEEYGLDPDRLQGDSSLMLEVIHPDDRESFQEALAYSLDHLTRFELTHRFLAADGEVRWMDARSTPRRLPDGSTLWNGIAIDVTDKKRAEQALIDEARFSQAVGDAMPALVYLYDADEERNVWANRRHREYFAPITVDSADLSFEDIVAVIHTDDLPALLSIHQKMTSDPACDHGEVEIRLRLRRRWQWMLVMLTAFRRDANGRLVQTMGTLFDISKRKKAELNLAKANRRLSAMVRQRDVLLREVNHRVKNNLLMVHSLLSLRESAANLDLTDVKNQVTSIGLVHELLHNGEDITHVGAREYLSRIMDSVFGQGTTVDMNIDAVNLPASVAVPVGLLVNEVATNAARHGFVDGSEQVFILELTRDEEAGEFVLTAANTGRRFPADVDPATAHTLGLRLITALVGQLGGTLDLHREPITRYVIRFPVLDEDSDEIS